ncbi:GNAT family N-acetyltransferase [Levilactobacillus bambusae]|uniref:N-acetyltransferase n=1 Tax=Levilactobacillus bambusae TaxID=2024736 RepID=A0A2V1MZJ6_9LACO|nr:N-acetyltransferase [Levilactobacillus bambusae]PWG00399.1 N-acetyltransferase [Levilactobacillus bambusae]
MQIIPVTPDEYKTTEHLVQTAFAPVELSDHDEHRLINRLRNEPHYHPEFDLVAKDENGQIIGHAMLSEIQIQSNSQSVTALALAPLAVLPEAQGQGVGGRLIAALETAAREADYPAISILGDPHYYGRFGYVPASQYQIHASFAVPAEFYMVKPLTPRALAGVTGTISYLPAFGID